MGSNGCAHPECGCPASEGSRFCSEACENAMSLGAELRPSACGCEHERCRDR